MQKALFLYNPKSGDQSIKNKIDYIIDHFQQAGILLLPFRMFQNDSFDELLQEIISTEKLSFIILSGGDGSLNFIVNFLFKNGINLPLGIFPCGTCNDFAHGIGMNSGTDDWIQVILSGKTRILDAGCINDRHYFIGNMGGGIFADASFQTHNELKKTLGPVAYYLKALSELPQIETFHAILETEELRFEENIILFLILNGRNVAGFSNFLKEADMSDGLMDILLFKNAGPVELANLFIKILAGELANNRNIIHIRAKECRLQADKKIQTSVDGEKGSDLPIRVHCVHPGIRLFVNTMQE